LLSFRLNFCHDVLRKCFNEMTPSQVLDETAAAIISAVHGRDEVVVVAAEEFRRLKGERTGAALIAALQASPYRDIDIEPRRERLPVRDVKL
jgi:hypothetical protein